MSWSWSGASLFLPTGLFQQKLIIRLWTSTSSKAWFATGCPWRLFPEVKWYMKLEFSVSQQEMGSMFPANPLLNTFTNGSSSETRWVVPKWLLPRVGLSPTPGCCRCCCHIHSIEHIPGMSGLIWEFRDKYQFSKKESLLDGCTSPCQLVFLMDQVRFSQANLGPLEAFGNWVSQGPPWSRHPGGWSCDIFIRENICEREWKGARKVWKSPLTASLTLVTERRREKGAECPKLSYSLRRVEQGLQAAIEPSLWSSAWNSCGRHGPHSKWGWSSELSNDPLKNYAPCSIMSEDAF